MKFDVVVNSFSENKKKFPIIRLKDGTPCIVGDEFCKVICAANGCIATYSHADSKQSLYEIHPGDIIGIRETEDGTVYLGAYLVDDISETQVHCTRI